MYLCSRLSLVNQDGYIPQEGIIKLYEKIKGLMTSMTGFHRAHHKCSDKNVESLQ